MAAEAVTDPPADAATAEQPPAGDASAPKPGEGKAKKDAEPKGKGKEKKAKDKKGKQPDAVAGDRPNVAAHPRAVSSIASAKGWAGLAGFVVGGYLSLPTSTFALAGMRALIAGVVCYVVAWGAAVFVWRRLVMLEIKAREQKLLEEALARYGAGAGAPQAGARDAS